MFSIEEINQVRSNPPDTYIYVNTLSHKVFPLIVTCNITDKSCTIIQTDLNKI